MTLMRRAGLCAVGGLAALAGVLTWIGSPRPAVAASGPSHGDIADVSPVGARAAWVLTEGNGVHGPQALLRTTDGGTQWSNVTPPGLAHAVQATEISSVDALTASRVWLAVGYGRHPILEATSDGGRRWARGGHLLAQCTPQFVNARDGWCDGLYGALGSMFVSIERTTDGGRTWRLVSETGVPGSKRSTPGALPFACDKTVTFTGRLVGFADSLCAGGEGYLYVTTDGGARWRRRLNLPEPRGGSGGSQFTAPAVRGSDVAVGFTAAGYHHPNATTVYRSADDGVRWTAIQPPDPHRLYRVAVVTPSVWRLIAGRTVVSTDDAGRSWHTVTSNVDPARFGPIVFTTPSSGWVLPASSALLHTTDGGAQWTRVHVP